MNEAEKQKIIGELKDFYEELKSYKRLSDPERRLSEPQKRYRESLREKLVRKIGKLKEPIIQLTGKQFYIQFGSTREFWAEGLSSSGYLPSILTALGFCIDATNEAIGKLEAQAKKSDMRDEQGKTAISRDEPFGKAIEIVLKGTPKTILPVIESVAVELHFKNKYYSARWHGRNMLPDFARLSIFAVDENVDPARRIANIAPSELIHSIGVITLQARPNGTQTLLRVPPCQQWDVPSDFDVDGSYFAYFLDRLLAELRRLGFKETLPQTVWQWLKSHKIFSIFITVIMFIAAIITIWGFVSGAFS